MRRVAAFVAICILGVASSATARERAPRFGILVTVGPRVGVPFLANLQGDAGWVLRPSDKRFGDGKRHGFFAQPGGTLLWRGRKWSYSGQPELRGREDAWGPVGRGDPAKGDRVDVPLIPGEIGRAHV